MVTVSWLSITVTKLAMIKVKRVKIGTCCLARRHITAVWASKARGEEWKKRLDPKIPFQSSLQFLNPLAGPTYSFTTSYSTELRARHWRRGSLRMCHIQTVATTLHPSIPPMSALLSSSPFPTPIHTPHPPRILDLP